MVTIVLQNKSKQEHFHPTFRIRDGRKWEMTAKAEFETTPVEFAKFDSNGNVRKGVSIYSRELAAAIAQRKFELTRAVERMERDGANMCNHELQRYLERTKDQSMEDEPVWERLGRYAKTAYQNGLFGERRMKRYITAADLIHRYCDHIHREVRADEVTAEFLQEVRAMYIKEGNMETTADTIMRIIKAFFTALVQRGEIDANPFGKLTKGERKKVLSAGYYADPFALTLAELNRVAAATVPARLEETRTAFVLQCYLGARVGDYARLTIRNVRQADGVPYVGYVAEKTQHVAHKETKTPLVRPAFDIVQRTGFSFAILRNQTGHDGYNARIRELLQLCGIDREVEQLNTETGEFDRVPLWSVASSKLARKTCVDLCASFGINPWASGLHSRGSEAAKRYTTMEVRKLFKIYNLAFETPEFAVTPDLEIINN